MNTLDIILLILLIPGAIRGITKGLLEQVISIGGIFLSVYAAYHFSRPVCEWLGQYIQGRAPFCPKSTPRRRIYSPLSRS